VIDELCLKPLVHVVRVRVFRREKPNDHSLLVLHPAPKNRKAIDVNICPNRCSLSARAWMPNSGTRKIHSIGCLAMPEVLLGSWWRWLRPLLMDHVISNCFACAKYLRKGRDELNRNLNIFPNQPRSSQQFLHMALASPPGTIRHDFDPSQGLARFHRTTPTVKTLLRGAFSHKNKNPIKRSACER
jgi:hypothetical protein